MLTSTFKPRGRSGALRRDVALKVRRGPTLERKVYKSRLEERIAKQIDDAGLPIDYETTRYSYVVPAKEHRYTPDFKIGDITIEAKGYLDLEDRKKLELIKQQHPNLDLRLVFQNSSKPIRKGSPTTYATWANKLGFQHATKGVIPDTWLQEAASV